MKETHWSKQKEAAAGYGPLAFTLFIFKLLPVGVLRFFCFPVGFFYFIFSKRARKYSRLYLDKLGNKFTPLKHIIAFSLALVEKIEAWSGKVSSKRIHYHDDDVPELIKHLEKGQGVFLLSAHLGNIEFFRALPNYNKTEVSKGVRVNAIVDFTVTAHFDRMLKKLNPHSMTQIISIGEMGPQSIIMIQEMIEKGEIVAITGDRTSADAASRNLALPFLGESAIFPYGPFFLAALSQAPIYVVIPLRRKDLSLLSHYDLHIHKSPVTFDCPRSERDKRIGELVRWYVSLLERYCKEHPYQWYNFYDFWQTVEEEK